MKLEITLHADDHYIEIVTKGVLNKESSLDMAKTIAGTMRHHRVTKALVDHRNVTLISGNLIDVYERPGIFRIIGVILGIRIAEIINEEDREHFKFLETVSQNQGYRFSVFYDKSKAVEWLLG
jgi:hypothetical protein